MTGWRVLVTAAVVLAAGPACTQKEEAPAPPSRDIADWVPPSSFAAFVRQSDAAVIGRVSAIGPAYTWQDSPLLFRDATLAVEQVVYDSPDAPAAPGTSLVVRLTGDGTAGGIETDAGPVTWVNLVSGPLAPGDRVLWVLVKYDVLRLAGDFYASWHIHGDMARNVEPRRTAPLSGLVAKLRAERATPTATDVGRVDPLE